ncbi:MAG TPA: hypothetical protein V6C57_17435 [Coleofasciculaceae cyanobacterium]
MVRPVEQIEQEIAKLDQATATLAQEFHDAYEQYLAALSKAVRQQFVLASYHLCTHGYPEQFLKLSFHQRQELQRSLRQLAKQTQTQLIEQLRPIQAIADAAPEEQSPEEKLPEEKLPEEKSPEAAWLDEDELLPEDPSPDSPPEEGTEEEREERKNIRDKLFEELRSSTWLTPDASPESISLPRKQPEPGTQADLELSDRPTPLLLAQWQKRLEERIAEQLQKLSHTANRLFQKANVLPKLLPEPILEVASKADLAAETTASPPNLLNLLVESESEEEAIMTQVTTIRLRLSEIEFSDPTVAVCRSKVRTLMAQLNKLGREYQKRQKEKAIAQAESAWRSSWYED